MFKKATRHFDVMITVNLHPYALNCCEEISSKSQVQQLNPEHCYEEAARWPLSCVERDNQFYY